MLTRAVAIVPAIAVIFISGSGAINGLLVLSQVVLSLALPFAVVPLVWLTASRARMGGFKASAPMTALASVIALAIIALNGKLILDAISG
jgi:manganese transport protein